MAARHDPGTPRRRPMLSERLGAWPDEGLSLALVLVAVGLTMAALFAPALVKAVVLAWVLLP
jgi:hypothetical protein